MIGVQDPDFLAELHSRTTDISQGSALENSDLIFVGVEEPADLWVLGDLRPKIKPNGAIWVIRRKGAERRVREVDVIEAGKMSGLVDNKIASFSDTHGAMRLVIPLKLRAAHS